MHARAYVHACMCVCVERIGVVSMLRHPASRTELLLGLSLADMRQLLFLFQCKLI